MDDKDIRDSLKDDNLSDTVSNIYNTIQEQQRIFTTKILVQDIIDAYNGKLDWDTYLKERQQLNAEIKETNNRKVFDLGKKSNEYKLEYRYELPVMDFHTFVIAQNLGKIERGKM